MPSDSLKKRLWPQVAVLASGLVVLALMALLQMPPGRSDSGVSTFEFVNQSDEVVSNLDLDFCLIVPNAGKKLEEYSHSFRRHFTNLAPGGSVVVQSNTPILVLCSLSASHRDLGPTGKYAEVFMGVGTVSGYESPVVTARPGHGAGIRFMGYQKFTPFHAL